MIGKVPDDPKSQDDLADIRSCSELEVGRDDLQEIPSKLNFKTLWLHACSQYHLLHFIQVGYADGTQPGTIVPF